MTFGTYEQDCGADNGMESIKWFILDVEDGRATLLSVHLLDCQRYHPEEADVTWEDCALRAWLNDDFLNAAFTKAEQEYIAVTGLINGDTPAFGTQGGNDTSDRIWLFSLEDLEKYFQISLEECMNVHENQSSTMSTISMIRITVSWPSLLHTQSSRDVIFLMLMGVLRRLRGGWIPAQ